jgi:hypothetical protein
MPVDRRSTLVIVIAAVALLTVACEIDEDLVVNANGSGSYRIKVTIPKSLTEGFAGLRQQAEKDGFTVDEGTTKTTRYAILRKKFDDLKLLNDDNNHFELTIDKQGLLRRDYRLRVTLEPIAFGAYQRQFTITMPTTITSASAGEIDGSRVRWNASRGGTIEIAASGLVVPWSRNQGLLVIALSILVVSLFLFTRRRQESAQKASCASCQTHLAPGARFCGKCGTDAPVAQT